jgi:hypothetical protein
MISPQIISIENDCTRIEALCRIEKLPGKEGTGQDRVP